LVTEQPGYALTVKA